MQKEAVKELMDAVAPIAHFITQWDRRPLSNLADDFYSIHSSTEYEARISISNFRRIRNALAALSDEPWLIVESTGHGKAQAGHKKHSSWQVREMRPKGDYFLLHSFIFDVNSSKERDNAYALAVDYVKQLRYKSKPKRRKK